MYPPHPKEQLSNCPRRDLTNGGTMKRSGISQIEVLATLGMICVLLSLLLPAIQSARESSRRTQCLTRLRSLGQASATHESIHGRFPAAYNGQLAPGSRHQLMLSPHVMLLPFLGQQPLFQKINKTEDGLGAGSFPATSATNPAALSIPLADFVCPSDQVPRAGNSYRACAGSTPQMHETTGIGDKEARVGIICGQSRGSAARQVVDGLSQTILFSEKSVGDFDEQSFTPWRDFFFAGGDFKFPDDALVGCQLMQGIEPEHVSTAGASWLFAGYGHTLYNHVSTPNSRVPDCASGRPDGENPGGGAFSARSLHRDLVHVVFGDGAARGVSQQIDLKVWRALSSRHGKGEIVVSDY